MKKKVWIIIGALFLAGLAIAGILYLAFPIAMTTYGGMGLNYLKTLSTPEGTVSTETNSVYVAPAAAAPSTTLVDASWPNSAIGDWPSYNRTPSSQRFSPLTQINAKNVGQLKVLCTYSTHQLTSFETSLIMVMVL
jgi:alcohol dehydrogenase (cytochrome c)